MTTYLVRRIAHAVIVIMGVTIVTFILQHLIASGPRLAVAILGPRATPGNIKAFVSEYGLNRPLPSQYLSFLWQLLHGNLGYSYKLNQSVDSILARDIPNDLLLVGVALILAIVIAIPLGIAQAARRAKPFDHATSLISFVLYSMPSFWLGLVLIELLAINLRIFPGEAPQGSTTQVLNNPAGLVLPIATLTLVNYSLFSRYMRSSAIDTLAQDFIRTVRAKGLSQYSVPRRHVVRNAASSTVTLIGLSFPAILVWGVAVEYVFNFPGTGLAFYSAAATGDYPLELGITFAVGIATVLGSLAADVAYAMLDPRIHYA